MRAIFSIGAFLLLYKASSQTIFIKDKISLEQISGVIAKDKEGNSIVSDEKGRMNLETFNLSDSITFYHAGYFQKRILYNASVKNIFLQSRIIELDEIVFSAGRQEESKSKVPYQIELIDKKQIEFSNQQTTADLLQNTGQVFVQKSQSGGGSPILRGFEANKILLVMDGVRMNNAIYRGGHLQDIITMDQNMLERTEVLFGPSSTMYGSDALGGVIHLVTKEAQFSNSGKMNFFMNNFIRYSSVNNEKTGHLDFNFGFKNVAFSTSITYSDFGDVRTGKMLLNGFDTTWKRNYHQDFMFGKDTIVKNSDWNIQRYSSYSQYDFMQKIKFKLTDKFLTGINFQYSTTSEINRLDRLSERTVNGNFKWAEWKYGPQQRMLASAYLESSQSFVIADHIKIIFAYQKIDQDRISRRFLNLNRRFQREDVFVYSMNADLMKKVGAHHEFKYGIEFSQNNVRSSAEQVNITTNNKSSFATRYPDAGSSMQSVAAYLSHNWNFEENWHLASGLRYSSVKLAAEWKDTTVLKLPFANAKIANSALSGNIGLVFNSSDAWKISLLASSGFRSPNVDDFGKINESVAGNLIIPNTKLKPEYVYNLELGINKIIKDKLKFEFSAFHTILNNAMVLKNDQLDGKDSVDFSGVLSKIQSLQNTDKAYLYGFTGGFLIDISQALALRSTLTYTYGRYIDFSNDSVVPLDHIPPVYGQTNLTYTVKSFEADFYVRYNGWKRIEDYRLGAEDNEAYATVNGMPSWYTLNLRLNYFVNRNFSVNLACENITDNHYRIFASGMSSPGRNFVISLRTKF